MKIQDLQNKKIAVLGYGLEGKSTAKFLNKLNLEYTILDKNLDLDYLKGLYRFDVIFKSPGISPYNNPELLKVKEKLTSQAEILADNFDGKIIGITGTKGKSTISTLLYEILKELGYKVKLVGNIGNPVLDEINVISKTSPFLKGSTGNVVEGEGLDFVVYELSSYMLEGLELNIFVGLLNNIYDCHLDWHNGRENYENAKLNVFKNAKYKLAGYELKKVGNADLHSLQGLEYFGLDGKYNYKNNFFHIGENIIIEDKNISLLGEHNRKNIAGIMGILDKIGVIEKMLTEGFSPLKKVLSEFTGLEHRQENIGTYKNITFINDGIAVTQESTIAAIKTFGKKIGTLFLGGTSTGVNYSKLVNSLVEYNIKNIVLFPDSGGEIKSYFGKYKPNILETESMEEAVKFGFKNTKSGEYCILSSAAQSFSLWKSFIEKGNLFKKFVKKYGKK